MSMSKKHFEALAAALGSERPFHPAQLFQWHEDVHAVANVCASFNPNFDRTRFLKACGVEEGK